ncbi:hypothetical protein RchiOBHm_Chr3g0475761 [Rosa chinensis]|uniref:Separase-like TPR repeats region domain-containing protein n=1 Tax=Rosa chinensis TaxID=74649 RepID=A0A2P6RCG9_ROSCH|nr:hypothetical protein RchiOBHm_Chr3g0475761 [Rosa chinensis]
MKIQSCGFCIIVWTLAKCASLIQRKEDEVYERLLCMVEELGLWFRFLAQKC